MKKLMNFTARVLLASAIGAAPAAAERPKPASSFTTAANKALGAALDLAQKQDFEDAKHGLIATLPEPVVRNAKGEIVC